ncbi:MAG TPA: hypothetical protein VHP83_07080 [Aggregatilineaceae bacterium]|nr:hypothetical protein [Aggregatilineaceae bacterium]
MAEITHVDYYWQGPGWYTRRDIKEAAGVRHEFHYLASLDTPSDEMRKKVKELEQPPYYLAPVTRIIKNRPEETSKVKVHE